MRLIKLLICLCLVPATSAAQEQIRKVVVGPSGDQFRIVYTITLGSPDRYKFQSMIIDIPRVTNSNEEPTSFVVDLTSRVHTRSTKEKKQKILLLRWKKTGELEFKCDDNWTKQDKVAVIDKILETTKAVIQGVPRNAKTPIEVSVTPELEQKILPVFESLDTETLPCLRNVQLP